MAPTPFRPLYTSPAAPTQLWVASNFTEATYAVYLTDFVHLWVATQTKRGISYICEEESCVIDPDVDESNLKLLLETLEKALYARSGGSPSLARDADQPRAIILKTVTVLPKLGTLRWNFVLKPGTLEQVSEILTKPFVKLSGIYREKIVELQDVVREKDQAIQRLREMVEESNGKNAMDAWGRSRRRALEPHEDRPWAEAELANGVAAGAEWKNVFPAASPTRNEKNEWWLGLSNGNGDATEEFSSSFTSGTDQRTTSTVRASADPERAGDVKPKTPIRDTKKPLPKREACLAETDSEDGGFEVQRTPSPIRRQTRRSLSPVIPKREETKTEPSKTVSPEDEETADEDDLDIPMRPAPRTASIRKTKSPSPDLRPKQPEPVKRKLGALGKKATPPVTLEKDTRSSSPPRYPSSSIAAPIPPSPAKRKLGALGGGLSRKRKSEERNLKEESPPRAEVIVPPKTEEEIMEEEADRKRRELEEKLQKDREKAKKAKKRKF